MKNLDTVGDRLEYAIESSGHDRRNFSVKMGVNYDTVGRWIRGNMIPDNTNKKTRIEQITGFSAAWIETGQGEKMIERTGYREPDYVEEIFQTDLFKRGTYIQKRFEEIHRTTGEIYLVEITARRIEISGDNPHEN